MVLVLPAWACDPATLASLPIPAEITEVPTVARGASIDRGVKVAGARVTFRSAHTTEEWASVLDIPENQDDWHPAEIGTRRVERLDASTIYQQLEISVLFGAITIRRQIVAGIQWLERSPSVVRNCWSALAPEAWATQIKPWRDGTPFQTHAMGSWDVRAVPEGGSSVSYTVWADRGAMPAAVQSWAMSRTLPELMLAFEAHVGGPRP